MRIAFFSPLNPIPTGISDYAEELLPALAEQAEIDVFIDGYDPINQELKKRLPIYSYRQYDEMASRLHYDINLFQMGNSVFHAYIYEMLQKHPGVTVLHDLVLHHFLCEAYLSKGNTEAYIREVGYSHGIKGMAAARRLIHGQPISLFDYPSFHRTVDASFGTIVHSRYAATQIARARPNAAIVHVPQIMTIPPVVDRMQIRKRLEILPEQLVVGSFGRIIPSKRLDVALRAFAQFRNRYADAVYLLVGEDTPECRIDDLIQELNLGPSVRRVGRVADLDAFHEHIAACDICINLRYPTAGETSAAVLRIFSLGKPTIVTDIDAFSELPDDCCLKVRIGPGEEKQLFDHLIKLADGPDYRTRMGENARELILKEHSPELVAKKYLTALDSLSQFHLAYQPSIRTQIAIELDEVLDELGIANINSAFYMNHSTRGLTLRELLSEIKLDG